MAAGAILGAIGPARPCRAHRFDVAGRNAAAHPQSEAPEPSDAEFALRGLTIGARGETFNLIDIAAISRGACRFNRPTSCATTVSRPHARHLCAGVGEHVSVGARVEERLAEVMADLPLGVELHPIYEQTASSRSERQLPRSLVLSVAVVIGRARARSWAGARRSSSGATLVLTVVGTFFFMMLFAIEVERISLGALIIAMGMLVDNAIVMAEGMQVEMRRGRKPADAAQETCAQDAGAVAGRHDHRRDGLRWHRLVTGRLGRVPVLALCLITISLLLSWVREIAIPGHAASRQLLFFARGGLAKGALTRMTVPSSAAMRRLSGWERLARPLAGDRWD